MFLKTGVYAITDQILHNDGSYLSNYFIHFLFVMKCELRSYQFTLL